MRTQTRGPTYLYPRFFQLDKIDHVRFGRLHFLRGGFCRIALFANVQVHRGSRPICFVNVGGVGLVKLGLANMDGKPTGKYKHGKVVVQTADKKQHNALIFEQVPLRIREADVTSFGDIVVKKRGASLCGVSHMRHVREHMKVKFAK